MEKDGNPTKTSSVGEKLDLLEAKLGRLGVSPSGDVVDIFKELDFVKARLDEGEAKGYEIRAERAQFETILASIRKEAGQVLRKMGGVDALRTARQAQNAPAEHWWWYLDDFLAEKRRQALVRFGRTAVIVIVVGALLVFLYQRFFAPDPAVLAEMDARQNAEVALTENNLDQALLEVEVGLEKSPDSAELLLLKAGILELMGKADEADPIYAEVEKSLNDEEIYIISRAQIYLTLAQPEKAITLIEGLLQDEPNSAKGYLVIGQAYEDSGDQLKALDAYEKASAAGEAVDDPTVVAQARIKLAMLMQVFGMPTTGGEDQATPAP